MEDFVGIGNILATVVVGLITCGVTWLVAKKSQNRKRLLYNLKISPILSRNLIKNADGISIYYQDALLTEPCLLSVNIVNTGNSSICNPPINIVAKDVKYLIPAYIEDIPNGYDNVWSFIKVSDNECQINLAHINKKQQVKARFYMDKVPDEMPTFNCPMADVEIKFGQVSEYRLFKLFALQLILPIIAVILALIILKFVLPILLKLIS